MAIVHVTEAGDAYHFRRDCRDLNAGQQSGETQGFQVRPIVEMEFSEATAAGRRPCRTCAGQGR